MFVWIWLAGQRNIRWTAFMFGYTVLWLFKLKYREKQPKVFLALSSLFGGHITYLYLQVTHRICAFEKIIATVSMSCTLPQRHDGAIKHLNRRPKHFFLLRSLHNLEYVNRRNPFDIDSFNKMSLGINFVCVSSMSRRRDTQDTWRPVEYPTSWPTPKWIVLGYALQRGIT